MQLPSIIFFLEHKCLHLKEHSTWLIVVFKLTVPLLLEQFENRLEIILQQFSDGAMGCDILQLTDLHFQEHTACLSYLVTSFIMERQDARVATCSPLQDNALVLHQYEELL